MGPHLYARGSIAVKIEQYLNRPANLAEFVALLDGDAPVDDKEIRRVLDALMKAAGLTAEEAAHLRKDYFTGGVGHDRFACYRRAFEDTAKIALAAPAPGYHIDLSWSCSMPDACAVNWTDTKLGRFIHIAVMAYLVGDPIGPDKTSAKTTKAPTASGAKRKQGYWVYSGATDLDGGPPTAWDMSADTAQGNAKK